VQLALLGNKKERNLTKHYQTDAMWVNAEATLRGVPAIALMSNQDREL
jgi:hypothetical protein